MMVNKILQIDRHRNGVFGEPFCIVEFESDPEGEGETLRMVAIVFDAPMHTAVLSVNGLANGNIAFAQGNSWRGDHFDSELRQAINSWEDTICLTS